ncbi:MAG TPA: hypothetical protein VJT67_05325 [Longimicrobiaceae bacterium]|nr:hypothetical protein [Longimicrobiaceae bacterium]
MTMRGVVAPLVLLALAACAHVAPSRPIGTRVRLGERMVPPVVEPVRITLTDRTPPGEIRVWGHGHWGPARGPKALLLVDGQVVDSVASADRSRIMAIDILRSPDAVARFGPRAAGGAVLITLKH